MATPFDQKSYASSQQIQIGLEEFGWLHELFKSSRNSSPRFRLPDLVSACISLALATGDQIVVAYLHRRIEHSSFHGERRTCHVFTTQFAMLQRAHRAPWNRSPNPLFELDLVATACVGVVRMKPGACDTVLVQARQNLTNRVTADAPHGLSS